MDDCPTDNIALESFSMKAVPGVRSSVTQKSEMTTVRFSLAALDLSSSKSKSPTIVKVTSCPLSDFNYLGDCLHDDKIYDSYIPKTYILCTLSPTPRDEDDEFHHQRHQQSLDFYCFADQLVYLTVEGPHTVVMSGYTVAHPTNNQDNDIYRFDDVEGQEELNIKDLQQAKKHNEKFKKKLEENLEKKDKSRKEEREWKRKLEECEEALENINEALEDYKPRMFKGSDDDNGDEKVKKEEKVKPITKKTGEQKKNDDDSDDKKKDTGSKEANGKDTKKSSKTSKSTTKTNTKDSKPSPKNSSGKGVTKDTPKGTGSGRGNKKGSKK